jgi:hypothetical protein
MAEDDHCRRQRDRRQSLPVKQPGADVGHYRVPQSRPAGMPALGACATDEDDADRRRGQCDHHQRHERAHWRRQHEQDDDRQHHLHELSGGALPADGPQGAPDIVHVAPVADAAMDVPCHAARKGEVEEHRPVVGRDGGGQ